MLKNTEVVGREIVANSEGVKSIVKTIGKGTYNSEMKGFLRSKTMLNRSYMYIKSKGLDKELEAEIIERNGLRYWEPYISEFRQKVEQVKRERIGSKLAGTSRRVTPFQEQVVIELYLAGYSTRAVSDALENTISSSTVAKIVEGTDIEGTERRGQVVELLEDIRDLDIKKYAGTKGRRSFKNNKNNKKKKSEVIEKMYILYQQGLTQTEIAKRCNVKVSTVSNYVSRHFKQRLNMEQVRGQVKGVR